MTTDCKERREEGPRPQGAPDGRFCLRHPFRVARACVGGLLQVWLGGQYRVVYPKLMVVSRELGNILHV